MYENLVSIKTKNENYLKSKIKPFQENYNESLFRIKSKSSMHNLAGNIYSPKKNNDFSPKKQPKRNQSSSMINLPDPELMNSSSMKGLTMRTSHVPNYSDLNTQLLIRKKQLQQKIKFLKESIAKETRLKNKAEKNCKINENEKQKSLNRYKDYSIKSERFNEGIKQAKDNCWQLNYDLTNLNGSNTEKTNCKNKEKNYIESLDDKVKLLKNNLLIEERNRNFIKSELIKEQKVMNSSSILTKQLEDQRAVLLLQINKSVQQNKL